MNVEIDLGAIGRNLLRIGKATGKPLILMVKADAYGHGMMRVARAVNAPCYGVATETEGVPLRELGKEVLVTAPSLYGVSLVRRYDMIPLIGDVSLAKEAAAQGVKRCHLAINSGMNRLGLTGEKEVFRVASSLFRAGVRITGVATHYKDGSDGTIKAQNAAFDRAILALGSAAAECGASERIVSHVTGNGALFAKGYDALRVGLAAYGYHSGFHTAGLPLEKAMRVTSVVIKAKEIGKGDTLGYTGSFRATKRCRAYTILGGYGDGIAREERGRKVIAAGRRLRIAAVSMDSTETVSDRVDLSVGDRVIILSEGLDAEYIAAYRGTIPYEVLLGYDVPRANRSYD